LQFGNDQGVSDEFIGFVSSTVVRGSETSANFHEITIFELFFMWQGRLPAVANRWVPPTVSAFEKDARRDTKSV
jgi:hypothetical protein